MNDAFARIALAAGIALAPISVVTASPVTASPPCDGPEAELHPSQACIDCAMPAAQAHDSDAYNACWGVTAGVPTRPSTTASVTPAQVPSYAPSVQAPAQAPTSAALIQQPKSIPASSEAVQSAKQDVTRADPANPPQSPDNRGVTRQVKDVIDHHHADVVKGRAYPRHWGYTDHDSDGNPMLVNPTSQGTTFRYFYQGSYQEAYVEAGSSVALTGVSGVFPFTAVSDTNLASGTFYGGAVPTVYQNVAAYVPAYGQTVLIGTVRVIGHDDSQPAGEQDAMMINDTTLARGQVTNPSDGGQVTVAKTQTLPGVGPTDDGKSLVDLAAASQPSDKTGIIVAFVVGIGLALLALGGFIWVRRRRERTA